MDMNKWDQRFMLIAHQVATWSKDPSTQVGCVLVRPNKSIASTGFNGFLPGEDDDPNRYTDRSVKYEHVIHAEDNALAFLQGPEPDLTLYSTFPVCCGCVRRIVLARHRGIVVTKVIYLMPDFSGRPPEWVCQWKNEREKALLLLAQYNLQVGEQAPDE